MGELILELKIKQHFKLIPSGPCKKLMCSVLVTELPTVVNVVKGITAATIARGRAPTIASGMHPLILVESPILVEVTRPSHVQHAQEAKESLGATEIARGRTANVSKLQMISFLVEVTTPAHVEHVHQDMVHLGATEIATGKQEDVSSVKAFK